MSNSPDDYGLAGPVNPYAAPEASLARGPGDSTGELAEAEAIRRRYLSHEASVQSIGSLHYLGAILLAIGSLGMVVTAVYNPNAMPFVWVAVAVYAVLFGFNVAMGNGLRGLRPWARWTELVLMAISFLYNTLITFWVVSRSSGGGSPAVFAPLLIGYAIGMLILGYILYLMLSAKGTMVFSPEYKEVIARTPHIKYKTSCLLKGLLIFILILIVLGVVTAIIGGIRR